MLADIRIHSVNDSTWVNLLLKYFLFILIVSEDESEWTFVTLIEDLIGKGANIEAKEASTGNTPFLFAAAYGHIPALKLLQSKKPNQLNAMCVI